MQTITLKATDTGKFRTSALRNMAVTAPHMRNGSVATLEEAIKHYATGDRTIESRPYREMSSQNLLRSSLIQTFSLTNGEKQDLPAFSQSLTDKSFLTNPKLSSPYE